MRETIRYMLGEAVSGDLAELLRVQRQGFSISTITLALGHVNVAQIQLSQGGLTKDIESSDPQLIRYCESLKRSFRSDGRPVFRPFKDLNRYWNELRSLTVDASAHKKRSGEKLKAGQIRFQYDPRVLMLDFLRSGDRSGDKFLPLKRDHFEICLALLLESRSLVRTHTDFENKHPGIKRYGEPISKIFVKALLAGDGLLTRAIRFLRAVPLDAVEAAKTVLNQQKHVHDLHSMLAARGPIRGDVGLPHLLDGYRRQCEALRIPIAALAEAVSMAEGEPPAKQRPGYGKCVERIRRSYPEIVDCLDPDIRNSESHGGTILDHDKGTITLTEVSANGSRRTIREYTYWQFAEMAAALEHGLLRALTLEIAMQEIAVLVSLLHSRDYCELLLSIDNLQLLAPDGLAVP